MATIHSFLKSLFTGLAGANVDAKVLRETIEQNGIIVVPLLDGVNSLRWLDEEADPLFGFTFDSTLPGAQLTELGVIVADHLGPDSTLGIVGQTYKRTVDPLVTDDETSVEQFSAGDLWINTTAGTAFRLMDESVGAADWVWTSFAGGFRATDSGAIALSGLIEPDAHPANKVLVTLGGGGAALVDFNSIPSGRISMRATDLIRPNTADWAINGFAPLSMDSINSGLRLRTFDDTSVQGVGLFIIIPTGAANLQVRMVHRPQTGAVKTVKRDWYERQVSAGAPTSWSSAVAMADITTAASTNWAEAEETKTIASWGLSGGELHQVQIVRDSADGGDDLLGDWNLLFLELALS